MKFSNLFAVALLTTESTFAAAPVACEISPKPALIRCAAAGSVSSPTQIDSTIRRTRDKCAATCLNDQRCISFSYDASAKRCRRFSNTVIGQGFKKNKQSSELFWNRNCFQMKSSCATTSTPSPTVSNTPTPSGTPSGTPSDTPSSTRSSIDLPTVAPAQVYNPPAITDFTECLFDPTADGSTFRFLDPQDGVPIVNQDGKAMKASEIIDPIPEFHFQPVSGSDGVYDLMLDDQYLAINLDGEAIFVSQSTGQKYVDTENNSYITSLFSYSCDGVLLTGLPGIVPFEFGFLDDDNQLYAQPIISQYNPPPTVPGRLRKRIPDEATRLYIAQQRVLTSLRRSNPVCAPSTHNVDVGSASTQRCPNNPVGLQVFDKPNARGIITNGCGSTGISQLVPNLGFGSCCNQHDTCYDTCSQEFGTCNDNFKNCNRASCDADYPTFFLAVLRWGCYNMADFYAWAVSGKSGAEAYTRSTNDRCTCNCPSGQTDCNGRCMPVLDDPNNCGACNNQCASGQCINGQCYVPPPPPPPPATVDPCDPDNTYDYLWNQDRDLSITNGVNTNQNIDFSQSRPASDLAAAERWCCNICYSSQNCVAYGTFTYTGSDIMCQTWTQSNAASPPVINPPKPDTCPNGGANVQFHASPGTGYYDNFRINFCMDIFHPENCANQPAATFAGKINPGPCAPGY